VGALGTQLFESDQLFLFLNEILHRLPLWLFDLLHSHSDIWDILCLDNDRSNLDERELQDDLDVI